MELIFKGSPMTATFAGKKEVKQGVVYRWSDFVFPFSHKGWDYLFNNLTKSCYRLDGEELNTDKSARFSSDDMLTDDNKRVLCEQFYLVPEDKDEAKFYEGILRLARALKRDGKGYTRYTILPTTACNARCVYCFEQGVHYETMKRETVEQLIKFILKTHNPQKEIKLVWFGGEPLVGERIIDRVCTALNENGVKFHSTMVSNGSLVNESIIQKMSGLWNLRSIQITLDGVEDEYNFRKNYYHDYPSAYWHVLGRLKMLNGLERLHINIRVNVDEKNIDGVRQMFADLDPFLPHKERVTVTFALLFNEQASVDEKSLWVWDKCFEMYDELEAAGYLVVTHAGVNVTKTNFCMADNPATSVTVTPDGSISNCEHIGAFPPLGNIWDGVTNKELYQSLMAVENVRDKCRGCLFLPDCTTFSRCPNIKADCKYARKAQLLHALKQKLDGIQNESEDEIC